MLCEFSPPSWGRATLALIEMQEGPCDKKAVAMTHLPIWLSQPHISGALILYLCKGHAKFWSDFENAPSISLDTGKFIYLGVCKSSFKDHEIRWAFGRDESELYR